MVEAWAIFRKDLRTEYRTRYVFNAMLLFALVSFAAMSLAVGGVAITPLLAAVYFWIILFFSALTSLAQTFIRESETHTSVFLKLTAPTDAVFFGRWAFHLVLVLLLEALLTPLSMLFFGTTISDWALWFAALSLGAVGLVSTVTLLGALIAASGVRAALLPVLALPALMPLLVTAIRVTEVCFGSTGSGGLADHLIVLATYAVVSTVSGWLLFPFVWRE